MSSGGSQLPFHNTPARPSASSAARLTSPPAMIVTNNPIADAFLNSNLDGTKSINNYHNTLQPTPLMGGGGIRPQSSSTTSSSYAQQQQRSAVMSARSSRSSSSVAAVPNRGVGAMRTAPAVQVVGSGNGVSRSVSSGGMAVISRSGSAHNTQPVVGRSSSSVASARVAGQQRININNGAPLTPPPQRQPSAVSSSNNHLAVPSTNTNHDEIASASFLGRLASVFRSPSGNSKKGSPTFSSSSCDEGGAKGRTSDNTNKGDVGSPQQQRQSQKSRTQQQQQLTPATVPHWLRARQQYFTGSFQCSVAATPKWYQALSLVAVLGFLAWEYASFGSGSGVSRSSVAASMASDGSDSTQQFKSNAEGRLPTADTTSILAGGSAIFVERDFVALLQSLHFNLWTNYLWPDSYQREIDAMTLRERFGLALLAAALCAVAVLATVVINRLKSWMECRLWRLQDKHSVTVAKWLSQKHWEYATATDEVIKAAQSGSVGAGSNANTTAVVGVNNLSIESTSSTIPPALQTPPPIVMGANTEADDGRGPISPTSLASVNFSLIPAVPQRLNLTGLLEWVPLAYPDAAQQEAIALKKQQAAVAAEMKKDPFGASTTLADSNLNGPTNSDRNPAFGDGSANARGGDGTDENGEAQNSHASHALRPTIVTPAGTYFNIFIVGLIVVESAISLRILLARWMDVTAAAAASSATLNAAPTAVGGMMMFSTANMDDQFFETHLNHIRSTTYWGGFVSNVSCHMAFQVYLIGYVGLNWWVRSYGLSALFTVAWRLWKDLRTRGGVYDGRSGGSSRRVASIRWYLMTFAVMKMVVFSCAVFVGWWYDEMLVVAPDARSLKIFEFLHWCFNVEATEAFLYSSSAVESFSTDLGLSFVLLSCVTMFIINASVNHVIGSDRRAGFRYSTIKRIRLPILRRRSSSSSASSANPPPSAVAKQQQPQEFSVHYGPTFTAFECLLFTVGSTIRILLLFLMAFVAVLSFVFGVHVIELILLWLVTFLLCMWVPAAVESFSVQVFVLGGFTAFHLSRTYYRPWEHVGDAIHACQAGTMVALVMTAFSVLYSTTHTFTLFLNYTRKRGMTRIRNSAPVRLFRSVFAKISRIWFWRAKANSSFHSDCGCMAGTVSTNITFGPPQKTYSSQSVAIIAFLSLLNQKVLFAMVARAAAGVLRAFIFVNSAFAAAFSKYVSTVSVKGLSIPTVDHTGTTAVVNSNADGIASGAPHKTASNDDSRPSAGVDIPLAAATADAPLNADATSTSSSVIGQTVDVVANVTALSVSAVANALDKVADAIVERDKAGQKQQQNEAGAGQTSSALPTSSKEEHRDSSSVFALLSSWAFQQQGPAPSDASHADDDSPAIPSSSSSSSSVFTSDPSLRLVFNSVQRLTESPLRSHESFVTWLVFTTSIMLLGCALNDLFIRLTVTQMDVQSRRWAKQQAARSKARRRGSGADGTEANANGSGSGATGMSFNDTFDEDDLAMSVTGQRMRFSPSNPIFNHLPPNTPFLSAGRTGAAAGGDFLLRSDGAVNGGGASASQCVDSALDFNPATGELYLLEDSFMDYCAHRQHVIVTRQLLFRKVSHAISLLIVATIAVFTLETIYAVGVSVSSRNAALFQASLSHSDHQQGESKKKAAVDSGLLTKKKKGSPRSATDGARSSSASSKSTTSAASSSGTSAATATSAAERFDAQFLVRYLTSPSPTVLAVIALLGALVSVGATFERVPKLYVHVLRTFGLIGETNLLPSQQEQAIVAGVGVGGSRRPSQSVQ